MPRFYPNKVISDCWSSAGDVTFFHIDGKCYWKNRACPEFPGTPGQLDQLEIHRRALAAWKTLDHDVQLQWNAYAEAAPSHRPPFDGSTHITGHNLFVSAYHGFAQLGDEHVPEPSPWEQFPIVWMGFHAVDEVQPGTLRLRLRVKLDGTADPFRYRLHVRMQFTHPGRGRNGGKMRTFLAAENCTGFDNLVTVFVPEYRDIWGLDLPSYQVHCRYLLIDTQNGYRNIFRKTSFLMNVSNVL